MWCSNSRNTITYQRPFHLRPKPSLSDIRSLRSSFISSEFDTSTSSSVQPGIGYLSGKLINWVGEKILDVITPIEVRRRIWVIGNLIKQMEKESSTVLQYRILSKGQVLHRLVDDLLELSSYVWFSRFSIRSTNFLSILQ
jgi:hypothetical protein